MKLRRAALALFLIAAPCVAQDATKPSQGLPEILTVRSDPPGEVVLPRRVRAVLQDRQGVYWFATEGDGLWRYEGGEGGKLSRFGAADGMASDFVREIREDKEGTLWVTTSEGICRVKDGKLVAVPSPVVQAAKEGPVENAVWFPAEEGAYFWNGKALGNVSLPIDAADLKLRQENLGFMQTWYGVYSILQDRSGNVWIGTDYRGVCRWDGKTFTWFREKGLDKAAVRAIFQDSRGDIWFGNNGAGVVRFDGVSFTNFSEEHGVGSREFLEKRNVIGSPGTLARVWTFAEDNAGNVWIGTIDAGAWRYDGKKLTNFTTSDGLCGNAVTHIYKDRVGVLWFSTDGSGVCTYDGKSFANFDEKLRASGK